MRAHTDTILLAIFLVLLLLVLSGQTELDRRPWDEALGLGLGELEYTWQRTPYCPGRASLWLLDRKIQICFWILSSIEVCCGGGRWCHGKRWEWSLTDSNLKPCFSTCSFMILDKSFTPSSWHFFPYKMTFMINFIRLWGWNESEHLNVYLKAIYRKPESPGFSRGAWEAVAGGGGGWAFGLAPNPSCDQGSFYSFYILMFCGRFCISIVLFPIVHKKVCKPLAGRVLT